MRRNTPARAKQEREYQRERKTWLVGKACARCGRPADTVQHAKGRIGDLLLDKRFWIPLCWNPCHAWVENHPLEAEKLGLRLKRVA